MQAVAHKGLVSEMEHVASGAMVVNSGDWSAKPKDNVLLVSTIAPENPREAKAARKARSEGCVGHRYRPQRLSTAKPHATDCSRTATWRSRTSHQNHTA